jgi:hypothetical protein
MSMYGMSKLSDVFGGKIPGLNKPVSYEGEVTTSKDSFEKSPFREPKVLSKGHGFEDTILSLKGRSQVPQGSSANIEGKIFGNFKSNNTFGGNTLKFGAMPNTLRNNTSSKVGGLKSSLNVNTNVNGFEQMLFGGRKSLKQNIPQQNRVGGKIFNDFVARNKSLTTPAGKLEIVNVPPATGVNMVSADTVGAGAVDTFQQGSFETYGEQYNTDKNDYTKPKLGQVLKNVGQGIVNAKDYTVEKLDNAQIPDAVKKGFKEVGVAVGLADTDETRARKAQIKEANIKLEQQRFDNALKLAERYPYGIPTNVPGLPGYTGQPGYNQIPGLTGTNIGMPIGQQGLPGITNPQQLQLGILGPNTNRTPQQKVNEGFGMGVTGGVSPQNIRFASSFGGAQNADILEAGFLPTNEPFSNKVIQSLSPVKTVRPYTSVVSETLGGMQGYGGVEDNNDKLRRFLSMQGGQQTGGESNDDKLRRFLGTNKTPLPQVQPIEVQQVPQPVRQSQPVQSYQREYYKQEDLPGGKVYPRPQQGIKVRQPIQIPPSQKELQQIQELRQQLAIAQQQSYQQPRYPVSGYTNTNEVQPVQTPNGLEYRPVKKGKSDLYYDKEQGVWSERSKKVVGYKRGEYRSHKQRYIPPQQNYQQLRNVTPPQLLVDAQFTETNNSNSAYPY